MRPLSKPPTTCPVTASASTRQTAEAMEVPTAKSLSEIYPEDAVESQTRRWNSLISKFREDYGKLPDFISRSPGRVNIIGEVSRLVACSRTVLRWKGRTEAGKSQDPAHTDGVEYSTLTTVSTKCSPWL